jgi:hypothetical protein
MVWHRVSTKNKDGTQTLHKEEQRPPQTALHAQKHAERLYRVCRLLQLKKDALFDKHTAETLKINAKDRTAKCAAEQTPDLQQPLSELDAVLKQIEGQ